MALTGSASDHAASPPDISATPGFGYQGPRPTAVSAIDGLLGFLNAHPATRAAMGYAAAPAAHLAQGAMDYYRQDVARATAPPPPIPTLPQLGNQALGAVQGAAQYSVSPLMHLLTLLRSSSPPQPQGWPGQ